MSDRPQWTETEDVRDETSVKRRVSDGTDAVGDDEGRTDGEQTLRARIRRLEEENDRLREQYVGVRESRYARVSLALAGVGLVFGAAGFVVPTAQDVLFVLAATGLFAAVVTRYLTPEQFIPHSISDGIFATLAENEAAITTQLGLSSTRVYLPTDHGPRLFVPELSKYDRDFLAESEEFDRPIVVGEEASRSGLSLRPTGDSLLHALETHHGGDLGSTQRDAVETLAESVTDVFELATRAEINFHPDEGRVIYEVTDPLFGPLSRFDHPLVSLFGVGLASALETPVEVEVNSVGMGANETMLVACRWRPEAVE